MRWIVAVLLLVAVSATACSRAGDDAPDAASDAESDPADLFDGDAETDAAATAGDPASDNAAARSEGEMSEVDDDVPDGGGEASAMHGDGAADDDGGGSVDAGDSASGPDLPDVDAALDVEPAPLGTFVVARDGVGYRRASTDGAAAGHLEIPVYVTPFGPPRTLLDINEIDGVSVPLNLTNWTDAEGVLVLRVIAGGPDDDWLLVQAPVRPHNRSIWVRRSDFDFGFTAMRIEIDLAGEGELVLYDGDDVMLRSSIVQGSDTRPTPTHLTYIESGVRGAALSPAYGAAVLSMASFSETLGTFGGGLRPANYLHGTNQPELMGQRLSAGEIRVPDDVIEQIVDTITPGTPVLLFDSSRGERNRDAVLRAPIEPAATVSFAEGFPGMADAGLVTTPQLWHRCPNTAHPDHGPDLVCRRASVAVSSGLHPYLVAKPGAGIFDEEVGSRVIRVYDVPNGSPRTLLHEPPTEADPDSRVPLRVAGTLGAPLVLWPLETSADGRWVRVQAPIRPARRTVWVRAEDFEQRSTDYRIEIDLASDTDGAGHLTLYDDARTVLETDIVSGRESRPTPIGESLIDQVLDGAALSPAYGPYVLSFPLYSDVLATFGAGRLPRQAIHGTDQPELLGQRVASGHVRVPNDVVAAMAELAGGILGARVITFDSAGTTSERAIEEITDRPWLPADTVPIDDRSLPLGRPDF